ncbi:hypothetical protein FB107DRAFT_204448 [Schizophyllum commune]
MAPASEKTNCIRRECALTGSTSDDLEIVRLIHDYVATNGHERQMACMEWAWGLPRGGLVYYLISPANAILLSTDMADMFSCGHVMLFPTFKEFADAMNFSECVGIRDRTADDRSPRRPLTALRPPKHPYRYILFALTDTGRQLQSRLRLSSQTEEDWNRGVHPVTGKRLDRRTKSYPVVETHTHPVSVCFNANALLHFMGRKAAATEELRPWKLCLARFCDQWGIGRTTSIAPPQWFIEEEEKHMDDQSLCSSEASGYLLLPNADADCRLPGHNSPGGTDDSHYSVRVANWLDGLAVPEARCSRIPRLTFLMKYPRVNPLADTPAAPKGSYSGSPCREFTACTARRRLTPSWERRCHYVPSQTFTSNDWALFYYGVFLDAVQSSRNPPQVQPTRRSAR